VREDVPGLDFINRLRPVTYHLNIHRQNDMIYANSNKVIPDWEGKYDIEQIRMTGFLAQDVEEAALATEFDFSGIQKPQRDQELYTLRYAEFVVPLVKAVQEVNQRLEAEVETLQSENEDLRERIEILEAWMRDQRSH
jgi:hypothetical protein